VSIIVKGIKKSKKELLIAEGKTKLAAQAKRFAPNMLFKMMADIGKG